MQKNRLEAFSDGVIAIIITIMVLELNIPEGTEWTALEPIFPAFLSYILSFIYVGIYWNNHHHLCHAIDKINGKTLWANLHLLFWLSLFPFATAWMGENHFTGWPIALYGFVLLMGAVAWYILSHILIKMQGEGSPLKRAYGKDKKGKISILSYIAAIFFAFVYPWVSMVLYAATALMWLIPDRRIERELNKH